MTIISSNRLTFAVVPLLAVAVSSASCEAPVEPGDDFPDTAPPAQLGPEIDTGLSGDISASEGADITGRFDLSAEVSNQLSGDEVPLSFLAVAEQSGDIPSGSATVTIEIRDPMSPEESGPSTDQPAEISEEGAFEAAISGYTVPADQSDFLENDTEADLSFDAQIVDSDCFRGMLTIVLKDVEVPMAPNPIPEVELEGPFTALRSGTSSCGGSGTPDASSPETDTAGSPDGSSDT